MYICGALACEMRRIYFNNILSGNTEVQSVDLFLAVSFFSAQIAKTFFVMGTFTREDLWENVVLPGCRHATEGVLSWTIKRLHKNVWVGSLPEHIRKR